MDKTRAERVTELMAEWRRIKNELYDLKAEHPLLFPLMAASIRDEPPRPKTCQRGKSA